MKVYPFKRSEEGTFSADFKEFRIDHVQFLERSNTQKTRIMMAMTVAMIALSGVTIYEVSQQKVMVYHTYTDGTGQRVVYLSETQKADVDTIKLALAGWIRDAEEIDINFEHNDTRQTRAIQQMDVPETRKEKMWEEYRALFPKGKQPEETRLIPGAIELSAFDSSNTSMMTWRADYTIVSTNLKSGKKTEHKQALKISVRMDTKKGIVITDAHPIT